MVIFYTGQNLAFTRFVHA